MQVLEVSPELGRYGMRAHVIIGKLIGGGAYFSSSGKGGISYKLCIAIPLGVRKKDTDNALK